MPMQNIAAINDMFIEHKNRQSKPIVLIFPPGLAEFERLETENKLSKAGICTFPSIERAAKAIKNLNRYSNVLQG